jgi:hypothetical protein
MKERLKNPKNNPFFIDGYYINDYSKEFNDKLKNKIRKRDNNTCQLCKIKEYEHLKKYKIKLSIHHIDYNKKNCKEDNLITLCRTCNYLVNYHRIGWKYFFKALLGNDKVRILKKDIKNRKMYDKLTLEIIRGYVNV